MFGAVWCALAAVSTQVGDPGAEEHFQGVALTRCKDTVTPEDEATAEHLVDELKKLATKMGRLLECLRLTTTCGGGQEALVDVKRRIQVGVHPGGQPRYRERSMTEPFVARVIGVGPDSDTVFAHIVPPPFRGNESYYGDGPDESSFRLRVKLPFTLYPEQKTDSRYLRCIDAIMDVFSAEDLSYAVQPPGYFVKPPRAHGWGFRRRASVANKLAEDKYKVQKFDNRKTYNVGPVNELMTVAARLSGATSKASYAAPALHRHGRNDRKAKHKMLGVQDYEAGSGKRWEDGEETDAETDDDEEIGVTGDRQVLLSQVIKEGILEDGNLFDSWNTEWRQEQSLQANHLEKLRASGQSKVFSTERVAVFVTQLTPAADVAADATRQMPRSTRSTAMGGTAMGGGIKLCAGIPTAVQDLLRQPRNKEYMRGYRIAGVHEITLPHLNSTGSGLQGKTVTLHGTMLPNIPSILATGFRPSKAAASVYGRSVCVTPDMREASVYQSFIAASGELRSVRDDQCSLFLVCDLMFDPLDADADIKWIENGSGHLGSGEGDAVAVYKPELLVPRFLLWLESSKGKGKLKGSVPQFGEQIYQQAADIYSGVSCPPVSSPPCVRARLDVLVRKHFRGQGLGPAATEEVVTRVLKRGDVQEIVAITNDPAVSKMLVALKAATCQIVGTEHTLSLSATSSVSASSATSSVSASSDEPVTKRSRRSSSGKAAVGQSGEVSAAASGGEVVAVSEWLNLNDDKALPPIHANNMPVRIACSDAKDDAYTVSILRHAYVRAAAAAGNSQQSPVEVAVKNYRGQLADIMALRIVRHETSLRRLKQAIGEQHGEGLNHLLGYRIQPTYDEVRYDRIERLWSQVREVGISSIEGYSGDEAGQWLPSSILKFVLGDEHLRPCIDIPVIANATSLAFNAAYFEELFGLGWSEVDYLRLVVRQVSNAPSVHTRNSIQHNGDEVIVTLFGLDRTTIETRVEALNVGQPTPVITCHDVHDLTVRCMIDAGARMGLSTSGKTGQTIELLSFKHMHSMWESVVCNCFPVLAYSGSDSHHSYNEYSAAVAQDKSDLTRGSFIFQGKVYCVTIEHGGDGACRRSLQGDLSVAGYAVFQK